MQLTNSSPIWWAVFLWDADTLYAKRSFYDIYLTK